MSASLEYFQIQKGTTSHILPVFLRSLTAADGTAFTGVDQDAIFAYIRDGDTADTSAAITDYTGAVGTWVSAELKEIDVTNFPGAYQFGLPDAVLAAGADWAMGSIFAGTDGGVGEIAPYTFHIQLTDQVPHGGDPHDYRGSGRTR